MNGVSHMLPFVVGGGILIALAFLIDGLLVDLNHVPQYLIDKYGSVADVKSNFGTLTPVAYFLKLRLEAWHLVLCCRSSPDLSR